MLNCSFFIYFYLSIYLFKIILHSCLKYVTLAQTICNIYTLIHITNSVIFVFATAGKQDWSCLSWMNSAVGAGVSSRNQKLACAEHPSSICLVVIQIPKHSGLVGWISAKTYVRLVKIRCSLLCTMIMENPRKFKLTWTTRGPVRGHTPTRPLL